MVYLGAHYSERHGTNGLITFKKKPANSSSSLDWQEALPKKQFMRCFTVDLRQLEADHNRTIHVNKIRHHVPAVLETFLIGPNSFLTLLKGRVRCGLKSL